MARPSRDERELAQEWLAFTIAGVAGLEVIGLIAAWPLAYMSFAGSPAEWLRETGVFLSTLKSSPYDIAYEYIDWARSSLRSTGIPPWQWMVMSVPALLFGVRRLKTRRFSFAATTHGGSRVAWKSDLVAEGLFAPSGIPLGRYENSFKIIRNWEPLSKLDVAPPGTGKTVDLISTLLVDWPDRVPYRLPLLRIRVPFVTRAADGDKGRHLPGPSMIINDPKGEMYKAAAGWRSRLGPVFKLAWKDPSNSSRWNPLSAVSYPGGVACVEKRREVLEGLGQIYEDPRAVINLVLVKRRDGTKDWARDLGQRPEQVGKLRKGVAREDAAQRLQAIGRAVETYADLLGERENHIDRMCAILIPDTVEHHWRITGRTFLSGAIAFIMARAENQGREPTFGELVDELGGVARNGQFADMTSIDTGEGFETDDGAGAITMEGTPPGLGQGPADATGGNASEDKTAELIENWMEEAVACGYPDRVYSDLNETLIKPDKERGSVVSTAGSAINIFKNASVRAVTSSSSFRLEDIRGIDGRPGTWFIVVSLADAEFLGRITGLFFETHANFLMSQEEEEFKKGKGRPVLFIADEFWTLPPLQTLLNIPALGRGQWTQIIIVGQSEGQIATKYRTIGGREVVKTIKSAISYKVYKTQNDDETARSLSEAIGKATVTTKSVGRQRDILGGMFGHKGQSPFSTNTNESQQGINLFSPGDLMSMEKLDPAKNKWGWQLATISGMGNRPIECRPIAYFKRGSPLKEREKLDVQEWERDA